MESVHYFMRGLFRGIPETEKITEQREELETHLNERISDAISSGLPEKEAFTRVVNSLGNLDELIYAITGERKKIYRKKIEWFMMAGGALYGTFYMIAVGIWFSYKDFGLLAVYVAIPGWLGFIIPALIKYIDYRNHPLETALVQVDISEEVRSSVIGWLAISVSCWIVNLMLVGSGTFLSVIWAWMPTFGLLTWPLMTAGSAWMIRNLDSLVPASE